MNKDARDGFEVASRDDYAAAILDAAVDDRADVGLFAEMIDTYGPESLFYAMRMWVARTHAANPEILVGAPVIDVAMYDAGSMRTIPVDIDAQAPARCLALRYVVAELRDDGEAAANVMLSVPEALLLAVVFEVLLVSAQNVRCRARSAVDDADTWLTLWGIEQAGHDQS
jgi:hypothetical protein